MRVTIESNLPEALWGFSELIKTMGEQGKTDAEIEFALRELLDEDLDAVLDDAKFTIYWKESL